MKTKAFQQTINKDTFFLIKRHSTLIPLVSRKVLFGYEFFGKVTVIILKGRSGSCLPRE